MISRSKQIKIGAMLSYFGVFLGIVSGLFYNPWMINKIGDADYGLYTLAMSVIDIFLIDFGLSMASQRFISKHIAENDQQAVNDIVGLIYKLYIIITVVLVIIFVAIFFFVGDIYAKLTPIELEKFKVLYIMVAIYSVTSFPFVTLKGILSSYEQFIPLKVCDLLYKLLTITLTALALLTGFGVYALVSINLLASIIVITIRIVFIKRTTPLKANLKYKSIPKVKELFSFSMWSSVSVIASRLLISLGPSILGIFSGSFQIAVLGYSLSIESYIYGFVNAINGFFMPQLSRITASEKTDTDNQDVLNLMVSVGRFILLLFGLMFIGFAVLGRTFISMLVGEDYINSYYCVLLICVYGLVAYPQQIANTYTVVKNKVKERAIISAISFFVYLGLSFVLSGILGAIGIAVSICISLIVQTILFNIMYIQQLHINIGVFFKQCHLKMLPFFVLFIVVAVAISFVPIGGWIGFILKAMLIGVAYIILAWFLVLNSDEKRIIFSMLSRKKNIKS